MQNMENLLHEWLATAVRDKLSWINATLIALEKSFLFNDFPFHSSNCSLS